MNFHQDKKQRQQRTFGVRVIVILGVLAILIFSPIHKPLGRVVVVITHPIANFFSSVGHGFRNIGIAFSSKQKLANENDSLQQQLYESEVKSADYDKLSKENAELQSLKDLSIGRKVLALVTMKPNRTPYDTIRVARGARDGILVDDLVYVSPTLLIGRVTQVIGGESEITLFSTPGVLTDVRLLGPNLDVTLTGAGNGAFTTTLPAHTDIPVGTSVVSPEYGNALIGTVAEVTADPRDPFEKILIRMPHTIESLNYVAIVTK